MVMTEADYEQLPGEGYWEVVEGRAVLLPPPFGGHQKVEGLLFKLLDSKLAALGNGYVMIGVGVDIPKWPTALSDIHRRIPDLVLCREEVPEYFQTGNPPGVAIEILSTRRGNVERSEKMDDYARAQIPEYWIVNPFERCVEVYVLSGGDYQLMDARAQILRPGAFPGLEVEMREVWNKLG